MSNNLDEALSVEVSKLDADHYVAEDLDGVTESIFGSGSVAHATLQATQKNTLISNQNGTSNLGDTYFQPLNSGGAVSSSANNFLPDAIGGEFGHKGGLPNNAIKTTVIDNSGNSGNFLSEGNNAGQFSTATVGSLGASQLSSNIGSFQTGNSSLNLSGGSDGTNGRDGNNGNNGNQGDSGSDGHDSHSDHNGDVTHVKNITLVNINANPTIQNISITVDNTFIELGDTLELLISSVTDITQSITDINFNQILNLDDVNILVSNTTENLGNIVFNTVNQIDDITTKLTEIIDSGIVIVSELLHYNNVVNAIDQLTLVVENLHYIVGEITTNLPDINITALVDVTNTITVSIDGLVQNISSVVNNLSQDLVGNIIGHNNDNDGGNDSDIVADLGIDILDHAIIDNGVDIAIDPVEDLIGDLDLNLGLATDLLNHNGNNTDNASGDSDLALNTTLDVIDNLLADIVADTSLDFVESVTGDIDLDINLAADIFGDAADPLVNEGDGGTGEDTLLSDLGAIIEDVVSPIFSEDNTDHDVQTNLNIDGIHDGLDLDTGAFINPVEDVVGDIDVGFDGQTDIFNTDDIHNEQGDSDITVNLNTDVVGLDVIDLDVDIELDHIESIIGDVDLDLTATLDLLGQGNHIGDALNHDLSNGNSWTENTIGQGLYDDISGGHADTMIDCLPDFSGTVGEGLGVLDIDPIHDGAFAGGVFG